MEYRGYTIDLITGGYLITGGGTRILQDTYFPYEGETMQDKAEAHVDALIAQAEAAEQEKVDIAILQQELVETKQRLQDAEDGLIEIAWLLANIGTTPSEEPTKVEGE